MSQPPSENRHRAVVSRRRQVIAGATLLVALLLFLLGFFAHSTSPSSRVSFTATFDGGALTMTSTVTQHGSTVSLTEKFRASGKSSVKGTLSNCLPSGAVLDSLSHLQIVAPDGCLFDLAPGKTATITGKGPAATVLSGIGPADFQQSAGRG